MSECISPAFVEKRCYVTKVNMGCSRKKKKNGFSLSLSLSLPLSFFLSLSSPLFLSLSCSQGEVRLTAAGERKQEMMSISQAPGGLILLNERMHAANTGNPLQGRRQHHVCTKKTTLLLLASLSRLALNQLCLKGYFVIYLYLFFISSSCQDVSACCVSI